jgi:hypothetical protein
MASFLSQWSSHIKAFGGGIALALLGLGAYLQFGSSPDLPTVTVYSSPTCNCCSKWADHMRTQGFSVEVKSELNLRPVKRKLGVPGALASCHTAVVNDYVLEGHVPAEDVKTLLQNAPKVRGLSVPGMPVGSPGMERGARVEPYEVVAFTAAGDTSVVAKYGPR